jgi:hypothetical protein
MGTKGRVVAWVCIFSTLFMGCYSSVLVDPSGAEKDKLYAGDIEAVTTKDGTEYEFYQPARIDSSAIVGIVVTITREEGYMSRPVSIPFSDIQSVQVSQYDSAHTLEAVLACTLGVVLGIGLFYALLASGLS